MKNTREIFLFFDGEFQLKPVQIANEILSRYEFLGDPVILPANNNPKATVFVFNTYPDFQVSLSGLCLTTAISHSYFKEMINIVFDMVDIFESFGITFGRIGYIANEFMSPKSIDIVLNKFINKDNFGDIDEYNLSWYNILDSKIGDINCWQRLITDKRNFKDLLYQFDFNTPIDKIISLDMKNIKAFFDCTEKFIEKRVDLL